jgi:flagellar biosynthesis component FlhA
MQFFINRNLDHFIIPVICGFARVVPHVNELTKEKMSLGIVSRISCLRGKKREKEKAKGKRKKEKRKKKKQKRKKEKEKKKKEKESRMKNKTI